MRPIINNNPKPEPKPVPQPKPEKKKKEVVDEQVKPNPSGS
jgi:hypothetical protein